MILSLDQVACHLPQGNTEVPLLEDLSFSLESGCITALFGPSGGGKSTLLRLLVRFQEVSSGQIRFHGKPLADWAPQRLRRKVGLVGQQAHMFAGTVLDNLQLPFLWQKQSPPQPDGQFVRETLALCQLPAELLNQPANQLSIGQKQRVALARTLLQQPEVLLLDEPTSALDRPTADQIGETLSYLKHKKLAILLVSHDLRLLQRIADHGIFLVAGHQVEQGEIQDLLKRPQTAALQTFLSGSGEDADG